MNGFGMTGALSLAIALKSNTSLLELDISNNRIPMEGAAQFGKIFSSNDTLQILRVRSSSGLIFKRFLTKCLAKFQIYSKPSLSVEKDYTNKFSKSQVHKLFGS